MKKRAFFLTSLPLALIALGAQCAGFFFILFYAAEVESMNMPPFVFLQSWHSQQLAIPTALNNTVSILILGGLALAVLSLVSLVVSFGRHEPGWSWRLIPITLLALYIGTWLVVFI
jgi:hypothetical protein